MSLPDLSRRFVLMSASAILALGGGAARAGTAQDQFRRLEARSGGRLGVAALDTDSDRRIDYQSGHLWPICSTFKFLLAGAVLAKADAGHERLDRMLPITEADLLDYAPIVKARLAQGQMSINDLCEAAVTRSDNSAANLLLQTVGGPGGLNSFVRSLGDRTTHLDRIEPYLNEAMPGDARDTTSPAAMLNDLGTILLQDALSPSSRQALTGWMVGSVTGRDRLRAGLPSDWRVGDKTGSGGRGATNDIAIAWPAERRPILIAAYYTDSEAPPSERNDLLAEVARIIVAELVPGS